MNDICRGEPISFLRLERYLLDELSAQEREALHAHLQECEACSACCETLRTDSSVLPSLRPTPSPVRLTPRAKRWSARLAWPLTAAATGLAAAAALLITLRPAPAELAFPAQRVHLKGGELALELVREHDGDIALDAHVFGPGDRWEARVSCPPDTAARWDLVVFQGGETFFPLQATAPLRCGNHVTLPGAFMLNGHRSARVCVVLSTQGAVDQAALTHALPASSACVELSPVHAERD